METTINIKVSTLGKNAIEGLEIQAFSIKGKIGQAEKTNSQGDVSLKPLLETIQKNTVFLKLYDSKRLIKTTEKLSAKELKGAVKRIQLNANKLSLLSLPEDDKLYKVLIKDLQTRLTDYLYASVVAQLKKKEKKGKELKALREEISKLVEKEDLKKSKRQLSTILKETIKGLKKNPATKVLVEDVVVPEKQEKQSLGSFLRLGEAVNNNSWFRDKLKKEALSKVAELPFVKVRKREEFKAVLSEFLTKEATIKKLIDDKIVTKTNKNKLALWLDVSPILGDDLQLTKKILEDDTIKAARDLVTIRSKPQAGRKIKISWKNLIVKGDDLPITGREEDYIKILEDRIAARYPYAFMMDRLVQGDFVDKKNKEQEEQAYKYLKTDEHKAELKSFFEDFPDMDLQKIDLLTTTFFYRKKEKKWKRKKRTTKKINGQVNKHLLAMQRIFKVAPTYPLAAAMLKAGFHSAADVSNVPMKELRKRMQAVGVNTEIAQQNIVRLKARTERSVSQMMHWLGNAHALSYSRYADTNVDVTKTVRQELQKELAQIPGYEDHFGPQNYCKCAHCQSIYSPGAYFVDLMQYIKWAVEYNGDNNALRLKTRRNDLWEIPINCKNAHKEIPYLEVVNGVLEKYAQGLITKGLETLKRNPPQGLKLANLNLYLSRLVADKNITLRNIKGPDVNIFRAIAYHETELFSSFSLLQPTNLFLEASKLILGHFDLTLFDISEISDTVFDENKTRLYLGITKEEFDAISKTGNLKNNNLRYGELLQNNKINVADFLKKIKLTRTELKYLLASQFIKGEDTIKRLVEEIPNEVNKLNEFITGFSLGVANRFFRFFRLWQLLPWTIQELDLVLNSGLILEVYEKKKKATLNPNDAPKDPLFPESLQEITKMAFIQQQLEVSVEELVGVLSGIPTKRGVQINTYRQQYTDLEFEQDAPSLLYRLFKPIEEDLTITEETNAPDLARAINEHFEGFYHPALDTRPENEKSAVSEKAGSLLGVLKISETDLSLLLFELADPDLGKINEIKITDGAFHLDLDHVSLLYRYVKIADGLDISIPELIDLVHLVLDTPEIVSIDDVIQLIREYRVVADLPFSLEELTYATQDAKLDSPFYSFTEEQIQQAFEKTKEGIINQQIDINTIIESYVNSSEDNPELKERGIRSIKDLFEILINNKHISLDTKSGMFFSSNDDKEEVEKLEFSLLFASSATTVATEMATAASNIVTTMIADGDVIAAKNGDNFIADRIVDINNAIADANIAITTANAASDNTAALTAVAGVAAALNIASGAVAEISAVADIAIIADAKIRIAEIAENAINANAWDRIYSVGEDAVQKKQDLENLIKKGIIEKPNVFYTFLGNLFQVSYQKITESLRFIKENAVTSATIYSFSEDILPVIQSFSDDPPEIDLSAKLKRVLKQLNQTLFIFEKFGFNEDHISQIIVAAKKLGMVEMAGDSTRIKNLSQRTTIQRLQEFKKWIELTENTTYKLSNWFANFDQQNEEQQQQIATLLEITPQQLIEIKDKWLKSNIAIDDFQQLRKTAEKISLLGMSVSDFSLLTKSGYDNIKQANKAILNAFKSKYKTEAEWEEAYEPYQEKLQELKRDILVDYILNWRNHPNNRVEKYYKFKNTNDLYHYFLLDPEMSGCAQISKLKAATLSLQLYVQRVSLQLEKSEDGFFAQMDADLARQWVWRKNYRIWEANRKVFLYPENYIEPEWRDNKSPQFEKLEEELMQEEINADSVELAYKLYLNQFVEVANLTIAGQYYDDRDGKETYYLFGRTVTEPYLYYYRKYIPQTETRAEEWTTWERIDLPINSMEVTAIHYFGKLYLFWKEKRSIKNQAGQDLIKYILVYSKQLSNGVWMKPNILGGNKNFAECWDMKASLPFFSINPSTNKIEFENDLSVDTQPVSIPLPETPNFQLDPLLIWASIDEVDFSLNSTRSSLEKEFKFIISHADYRYNVDDLFIYIKNDKLLFSQNIFNSFISSGNTYYNAQVAKYFNTNHSSTAVNNSIEVGDLSNRYEYEQQLKLNLFSNSPAHLLKIETEAYILFPSTGYKSRLAREYYLDGSYEYTVVNQEWHNIKIKKADTTISNNLDQRFHTNKLSEFLSYNTQERLKESPVTYFSHPSDDDYSVAGSGGPYSLLSKPQIPNHLYYNGPYGTYFKELFFHIPFLIANHLNANQKFKEAKWWYERIFNPTPTAESGTPGTEHFWEFLPFRKVAKAGVASLKSMLQNTQSIGAYEEEPFMPHMIARVRTDAYMKAIVMKYIDNLLDWGDQLFSRDSFESINEAMMLYILAQDILGDKPVELGECEAVATQTYEDIEKKLVAGKEDDFLIYLENQLSVTEAPPTEEAGGVSADEIDQSTVTDIPQYLPLFCVPFNKDMLAYWNRVEDRLFKIRNCMNIKGQKRKLSLYEPPIDPRLLVAARASGLSLEDAIASVLGAGNLPHYRFNTILSKARDYVGTVQSFGSALLSAVEKKDVEQLTLLRSTYEQNILKLTKLIKNSQIEEAQTQLVNLQETKANVQLRVDYYEVLIEEGLIGWEKAQQISAHAGNIIKIGAGIADILPIGLHMVPKAFTTTGGEEAAKAAEAGAKVIHTLSSIAHAASSSFGIEAGNQRRKQEWKQQLKVAQQELKQVDQQILAAEIRIQINEQDLVVYEQQVEQAKELHDFYKNKLTKLGLYNYHATTLGRLFRHAYNMALDMAKQAERCYQFEVDDPTNYIIQNDNWDSSHYGFLAGERLLFQLQQLDKAYLEKNERRQEITQSFSLRQLDALALLHLKATGDSEGFTIPEWVFDMFYPGHYKRIIKSVRLSIPCVTGPYTNVPATLTLNSSEIRLKADWKNEPTGRSYGKMQSISTSSANNDGGLFEFNFRDERYLPFEGAGAANSKWSLSLPSQYRPFDYNTISDVIIHISYTSKFDGVPVGDDYDSFVAQRITDAIGTKYLLISLKHDFPNEYAQLMGGDDAKLKIGQTHFPYFAMDKTIKVTKSEMHRVDKDTVLAVGKSLGIALSSSSPLELETTILKDDFVKEDKAIFILLEYTIEKR